MFQTVASFLIFCFTR